MTEASSATSAQAADSRSPQAVTNKIFVAGLEMKATKMDIRELFSSYGDVLEVVVDGAYATVTFSEEKSVQEMVQMGEIMLNSTKLSIARVLEELKEAPDNDVPFYQAGVMPVPAPAPFQRYQYQPQPQPTEPVLRSSYPAYQTAYPAWYQPPQLPPPSQHYDQAIHVCGPAQQQQHGGQGVASTVTSLPPSSISSKTSANEKSVFSFDMHATQGQQQLYQPSSQFSHVRSNTGCCHVCSLPAPAVQGVAPLPAYPQYPGDQPYYSLGHVAGHQLQPLTPITPSVHTGYLLPPTPTPTSLPPMTPTYYLPPSPAPSHMFYSSYNPLYARTSNYTGMPYTGMPYTGTQQSNSNTYPGMPQPQTYTTLKQSDNSTSAQEEDKSYKQNVAYFTSPFKRFSKFRGTPTPAGFPLRASNNAPHGSRGGVGSSSGWYQQGDRWGQRSGGEGDAPDIVKDC